MADPKAPGSPEAPYSIVNLVGDGTQLNWEFSFSGGYVLPEHIKVEARPGADWEPLAFTLSGPSTITVSPAIAVGVPFRIYRDTPVAASNIDFADKSLLDSATLDKLAKQAVLTVAEEGDRRRLETTDLATRTLKVPEGETAPALASGLSSEDGKLLGVSRRALTATPCGSHHRAGHPRR